MTTQYEPRAGAVRSKVHEVMNAPRFSNWLRVEAALALAQGELGVIPGDAASKIAAVRIEEIDLGVVRAGQAHTGHPLVPFIEELARAAGAAGGYVHWGATTQNITQTSQVLQLKEAHSVLMADLAGVICALRRLALEHADTPMPGRTHGQPAVPITFGFKLAVWLDDMLRALERLIDSEKRIFVGMLGGAVGNFASMGEAGPEVQRRVMAQLGLEPMAIPARSQLDHFAEYICLLGLMAASLEKLGHEVYRLMEPEYGEMEEPVPEGSIGSSTMPQKRNPKLCQVIISNAMRVRASVPLALNGMLVQHEADAAHSTVMSRCLTEAVTCSGDALLACRWMMENLQVFPDRMRQNLEIGGGEILGEPVMLKLAEFIGRQEAHHVVYESAMRAAESNSSFSDEIRTSERITRHLSESDLGELLDPAAHTGLSGRIAVETARRAEEVLRQAGLGCP
jgi:3-carboxy-cis,cis-muconate cycloisomerase